MARTRGTRGFERRAGRYYVIVGVMALALISTSASGVDTRDGGPPDNDDFAAAYAISGISGSVTGSTSGATVEPGEREVIPEAERSVWWTWVAPDDGRMRIDVGDSDFPAVVNVVTGDDLSELTREATSDPGTGVAEFVAEAGESYRFHVDGGTGGVVLGWSPADPVAASDVTRPGNDDFASPALLAGTRGSVRASNVGATVEDGEREPVSTVTSSVWWSWTAPEDGPIRFDTFGSEFDTMLAVYTGDDLIDLEVVAANDNNGSDTASAVTVDAQADVTYRLQVDGVGEQTGAIVLNWSPDLPAGPSNDAIADATLLEGPMGRVSGTNRGATVEFGEQDPFGEASHSVWWTWVAPAGGPVSFETTGSDFDTVLAVYSGDAGDWLTEEANNNDHNEAMTSWLSFEAIEGLRYYVQVDGKDGQTGDIELRWEPYSPEPVGTAPAPRSTVPQDPEVEEDAAPSDSLDSGQFSLAANPLEWVEFSLAANPLDSVEFSLAANSLDAAVSSLAATFDRIPASQTTGEKPQSKVWQQDGIWFTVMPSTAVSPAGTWVWQRTPGGWSNVMHLSNDTNGQADVKQVGNVVHVGIRAGSATARLVSIEYVDGAYQPWSVRPGTTNISLSSSETFTIDIDTTGRMWLATDSNGRVDVHNSAYPYTSFSGPHTLSTSPKGDDITAITALPGGRIGVMWSDQNTQRFGFRVRNDGDPLTSWGADEVPAGHSAEDRGGGMADDHINLAVGADGTVYAAIKTSYDTSGMTTIGLLVRRPNGTWDDMHRVHTNGTRGIVVANDEDQTVRVLYNSSTGYKDVLIRTAQMGLVHQIGSSPASVVLNDDYRDITSMKANWSGQLLVMAGASNDVVGHAFLGADEAPSLTALSATFNADEGTSTSGTMTSLNPDGEALTYEIVTPPVGTLVVDDPATGAFTYTPAVGQGDSDSFVFSVTDGTVTSQATITIFILPVTGTRGGTWRMDENGGTTLFDSSPLGNHGVITGDPTWIAGRLGRALLFDGEDDQATVAAGPALDVDQRVTMAAWVRPDTTGTQRMLMSKATDSQDGFELALTPQGNASVILNGHSSGTTYQIGSPSALPSGGVSWSHVAATFDGTTMRLYVNGQLVGSKDGPTQIATNELDLVIGARSDGTFRFRGALDEVRLYDSALSAAEIASLASQGSDPEPEDLTAEPGSFVVGKDESVNGTLTAINPTGSSLTYSVAAEPVRGAVTIDNATTGAFTYVPAAGFIGADSFTFEVSDGGDVSQAVVEISIVPNEGAAGIWAMDEGGGTSVADSSGQGNHGTFVGAPTWVAGRYGGAVRSDTGGNHVAVDDDSSLDIVGELTLAAWVKPERSGTQRLINKGASSASYELSLSNPGLPFFRLNNSQRVDAATPYPIDGSTWIHVAGVYDGSAMRIYVNGVEEGTRSGQVNIAPNDLPLALGATSSGSDALRGAMDEVRIYDRALSPSEVAALAGGNLCVNDEYEPNDTRATAASIPVATPIEAVACTGDVDHFAVTVQAGDDVTATVTGDLAAADPALTITDPAGTVVADGSSVGGARVATHAATVTGTYTVAVSGGIGQSYTLQVDVQPASVLALSGTLVAGSGTSTDGLLAALNPNDGDLTFSIVAAPAKGSVQITDASTGSYTYTADSGAFGADHFTFEVTDGVDTSQAAIEVTILPIAGAAALWIMDDGAGTTVTDSSGQGNHGMFSGMPTWVEGQRGGALRVDNNAYVTAADSASLDVTGPITLAAWVKPERSGTQRLISKGASSASYELSLSNPGLPFFRLNNSQRVDATTPYPIDGSTWMHVAGVYDGSAMRIYVNGVEEGTRSGQVNIAPNDLPLALGARSSGSDALRGAIDEVGIYDRALSPSEVAALAGGDVCVNDEFEPNDTPGQAAAIGNGVPLEAVACAADVDHFGIDLNVGDQLTATVTGDLVAGSPTVMVLDPDGEVLVTGVSLGDAISAVGQVATAGVHVVAISGGTGESYTVQVDVDEAQLVAVPGVLTVAVDAIGTGTLTAINPAEAPLTYSILSEPAQGEVELLDPATGEYRYTPEPTASGTDSFDFEVTDGVTTSSSSIVITIVPASGAVGLWNMDEGEGTVFADASGNGNHGAFVGSPTWVDGVVGTALRTAGGGNYGLVPHNPSLTLSDGLTLATWVRPERSATQRLISKGTGSGTSYELSLSNPGRPFFRLNNSASARVNATSAYPTDGATWMHVAGVYDGSSMRIYVNGVEEGVRATAVSVVPNTLSLGIGATSSGSNPLLGAMDNVMVFNRALSPAEVMGLADP